MPPLSERRVSRRCRFANMQESRGLEDVCHEAPAMGPVFRSWSLALLVPWDSDLTAEQPETRACWLSGKSPRQRFAQRHVRRLRPATTPPWTWQNQLRAAHLAGFPRPRHDVRYCTLHKLIRMLSVERHEEMVTDFNLQRGPPPCTESIDRLNL